MYIYKYIYMCKSNLNTIQINVIIYKLIKFVYNRSLLLSASAVSCRLRRGEILYPYNPNFFKKTTNIIT